MNKTGKSAAERRREKRWNLRIHLPVFDEPSGNLIGHVVDIATKGLQLVSEEPIPVEKNFQLLLEITREDGEWEKIPLRALSIWSRRHHSGVYNTGFHIFAMPPESRQRIIQFINTLDDD